nr:immunoglobulin heavy chain junction region [Mus musculus]
CARESIPYYYGSSHYAMDYW